MKDLTPEKSLAADEINNRLFFRFFQAANTLQTKSIQALGVTTLQWSTLGALSRPQARDGMRVSDLSRYLLVSRQNLFGLLNRLERDGLIERVTGEEDRRSRKVKLTREGETEWLKLSSPIQSFYDSALKGLSFDDRLEFFHYVSRLQRNMAQL